MNISRGHERVLPSQKVGAFSQSSLPYGGFSSYDWTGKPVSNDETVDPKHWTTPILYHRGTWRAYNLKTPTTLSNTLTGPSGDTLRFTQYGNAMFTRGRQTQTPTAILYNVELAPNTFGGSEIQNSSTTNMNNSWATIRTYLAASATALTAKNACLCEIWSNTGNYRFVGAPFLFDSNPSGHVVSLDETHIVGGNLLSLHAAYSNNSGTSQSTTEYVNDDGSINTTVYSPDLSVLSRAYGRFRNFTSYVYIRRHYDSANEKTRYDLVGPTIFGFQSDVTAYQMTIRGPYNYDQDISSTIQADVASWLASL